MLAIVSVGIANLLILQRVVILWEHRPVRPHDLLPVLHCEPVLTPRLAGLADHLEDHDGWLPAELYAPGGHYGSHACERTA